MLTSPAVGSFIRHEAISGASTDLNGYIAATAEAADGTAYEHDPGLGNPNFDSEASDIQFRKYLDRDASAGGAQAHAFVKTAGYVLTPTNSAASAPFTSMEAVQLANAQQTSGFAEGKTDFFSSIISNFEYDDPTPTVPKEFYGRIYIPAVGVGLSEGDAAGWGAGHITTGHIQRNNETIALVEIYGSSGSGSTQFSATISVVGQDPYTVVASGQNLYVNVIVPIEDGDVFEFISSLSTTSAAHYTNAIHFTSSSQSLYSFAQSVTAYGFACDAGSRRQCRRRNFALCRDRPGAQFDCRREHSRHIDRRHLRAGQCSSCRIDSALHGAPDRCPSVIRAIRPCCRSMDDHSRLFQFAS